MSPFTYGSLFSGIGGLDYGLELAGLKCVWQVEKSEFCRQVLTKHWPDVWRHDDVHTFCKRICDCEPENEDGEVLCKIHGVDFGECDCIGTDQFLDEHAIPDIIVGGDPCQENTNCRRNGDTTSPALGSEFIRILGELRPQFVLRENPSVVRSDAPWPWQRFRSELERMDYAVIAFRLRACCVGADFRRDRLFLLAELQESKRARLEGHVGEEMERKGERRQDADTAGPNRWSATPRICGTTARIPRRMDRLKGLGNCVVPQVAEWIGRRIVDTADAWG